MKKDLSTRLNILLVLVLAVFLAFTVRLIQYQIIQGDEYYEKSSSSTRVNQTITVSRGNILDRNGNMLAGSRLVYNVTVNKVYMPDGVLNERLIEVLDILWKNGETVNDILPISRTEPFTLDEDRESELGRLRDLVKVAVYASRDNMMDKLIERYSLEDVPDRYRRALAGIRYTMERDGYSNSFPFTLARDVSDRTAAIISEKGMDLTGIEIVSSTKREYLDGTLLPHILGTVGPIYAEEYRQLKAQGYGLNDILGKSGLERAYESQLRGTDGLVRIEKNIYGEITDYEVISDPKPGNNVILTIDGDLQKRANRILRDTVRLFQTKSSLWGKECTSATMVVLDARTGGVLAVCNYPNYDLNDYSTRFEEYSLDPDTPLFNRAFQGLYRPGSVFKVNLATAALRLGIIDENYTYTCHGTYDGYTVREWGGPLPSCANGHVHGTINVKQALKVSCNCFFYDLGRKLGIDNINSSAQMLGLGTYTGLEINEQEGILSSPEHTRETGGIWQPGNIIQASIGQLDTMVTPVQLATYVNTVANKGTRRSTHIVDRIESYDGSVIIYQTPDTVLAVTENTNGCFDIVEKGMVLASTEGSAAIYLSDLPYVIASKTGTAQVSGGFYNATMIAYGPVGNPDLAIAIVAEKGGNGYNLAYAVREVFAAYYDLREQRRDPEGYAARHAVQETSPEVR